MSIDQTRAAYRVLEPSGFFSDNDTLYQEGDEIYFDGEPNEQLEPLNQLAKTRLVTYLEKLDANAKLAAERLGRPYIARPRNLDGAVELATALQRANVAIMGTKDKITSTERVEKGDVPETGGGFMNMQEKRGRGRPRKTLAA